MNVAAFTSSVYVSGVPSEARRRISSRSRPAGWESRMIFFTTVDFQPQPIPGSELRVCFSLKPVYDPVWSEAQAGTPETMMNLDGWHSRLPLTPDDGINDWPEGSGYLRPNHLTYKLI